MKTKATIFCVLAAGLLLTGACKSHYKVVSVERTRLVVDSRYDAPNAQAMEFLKPYKAKVDSVMGPVVGRSAKYMTAQRPEGTLSNLLSDIMVWGGKFYDEKPDFGMYNIGGVRADLPKGEVTYGDVLDIAPFENKIAFGTLKGSEVLELFSQIAATGGEGVSHSVRLVITKDLKLVSATIDGKPIDPEKDYRLATIDYLLGGTDKMEALKKCRDVKAPQEASNNTRFIIMDYFKEMARQGKEVDAEIEGRIRSLTPDPSPKGEGSKVKD